MSRLIRIGSRDSELALWQAHTVKNRLDVLGINCEIVTIKSDGDLKTELPLYELGITGIFTRALDVAMLNSEVDIAVHSMKDVPTVLPKGIVSGAVLERANPRDILVHKGLDFLNAEGVVATGSLRRKAQWLHRYPLHEITNIRGNVPTRLKKLKKHPWNAAIFAAAGLERLGLRSDDHIELQWMVPAPAQGAILVVALEEDHYCLKALELINDRETAMCTQIERDFLKELEGGCSAPIGALAKVSNDTIQFRGMLASLDGQQLLNVQEEVKIEKANAFGVHCAQKVLSTGGAEIMKLIKTSMSK